MLLVLLIFIPILAAVAIGFGAKARAAALGAAVANLALGAIAFLTVMGKGGGEFSFSYSKPLLDSPQIAFAFGIDGIGATLVLLTVIVTFCAVLLCPERLDGGGEKLFAISALLISAGALGAFCATDLFFFYAFHELALIPTFLMIGIHGHGKERIAIAWKVTIYLGLGSLVLLGGLIALVSVLTPEAGATLDIATLAAAAGTVPAQTQAWLMLTLIVGFGILVSLFPFHSWAAPAYAAAPTPVAMLHAGVLKKFGLYGMIRVAIPLLPQGLDTPLCGDGTPTPLDILLVLLVGNILFVGFVTLSQRQLDRMLGNSSVMHMGYAYLGIACLGAAGDGVVGAGGAVLMLFAHGISIALLFALCGALRERLPDLELNRYGGLASKVPALALAFALAAFASLGLPGFANFASEITIFLGAFKGAGDQSLAPLHIATILALWGVVISAVYMLRAFRRLFQGASGSDLAPADLRHGERLPIYLLIAVLLVVGFFPSLILNVVAPAVASLLEALTPTA